ncbi:MAG TPA: hypothetical protein VFF06_14800 [Polyangia bacterium]|nr:hypothetical protein [Polyangia bacterium]
MKYALAFALFLSSCGGECAGDPCGGPFDLSTAPSDLAGAPATTYSNFAQNFFATYCVRCHPAAGESARDFTKLAVIQTNAHDIMCGVSPTALAGCSGNPAPAQFPIGNGPFPSDDERNRLVAWIQAGLPQ